MNDPTPIKSDKFRAYRARKKAAGLREVRLWVPDVGNADVQRQIDDQIRRINASRDETEVLAWCDRNAAESWRDLD